MFKSARLKLTAWYLLIIMMVSLLFSVVIFIGVNRELSRFERLSQLRREREGEGFLVPMPPRGLPTLDPEVIGETRNRLVAVLVLVNLGILGISGAAGYFLAGKTLKPIVKMMEEQNRFIADASHELGTPLTALKTTTEVTLRDKKLTFKQAKALLVDNLEEINSLQTLSNNLLQLAQQEETNGTINLGEVSLNEVFAEATRKADSLARKKEIKIVAETKDYRLKGDNNSLVELLIILLDNAIKYSPPKSTINVGATKIDHMVQISVNDQGMGIEKTDLPHIFDRSYRADKSRTGGTAAGYGLGLPIAKKIVEMHNGTINVESVLKKGTTFTVKLPLKDSLS